ncbi:hypothetical protein IJJ97_00305 [bacterium]|nr:hypothetical protein [bacterium]
MLDKVEFREFDDKITFRGLGKDFFDYMTNYILISLLVFLPVFLYFLFNFSTFTNRDFGEGETIIFIVLFFAFSYALGRIPYIFDIMNKSDFEISSNGIRIKSKKTICLLKKII